eukprot:590999-Pyramimonas_sp.AAC.1
MDRRREERGNWAGEDGRGESGSCSRRRAFAVRIVSFASVSCICLRVRRMRSACCFSSFRSRTAWCVNTVV